tara:strand:- start:357 stop:599 length:243 start_codon:yes stop_codon:yes gene_type:complete
MNTIQGLIGDVQQVFDMLLNIGIAVAILFFFWGVAKFILKAGDVGEHEKGKNLMVWGIVALFVIFSIKGIIVLVQNNLLQ